MTAQVRLALAPEEGSDQAVAIPLESLLGASGNEAHVFQVDPDSHMLSRKKVRFEALAGNREVRITAGLSPEDLVVAEGAAFVRQGQKVQFRLPGNQDDK